MTLFDLTKASDHAALVARVAALEAKLTGVTSASVTPPPTPVSSGATSVTPRRPFAANSPWNTPLPADAKWVDYPCLHTNAAGAQRMWWAARHLRILRPAASNVTWTLTLPAFPGDALRNRPAQAARTMVVSAPADAGPAFVNGGDAVVVWVQPNGTYVETWRTTVDTAKRTATCEQWVTGDYVNGSGCGSLGGPRAGVRAANMSWGAGAITADDIAAGVIPHALAVLLADGQLNTTPPNPPFVSPATASDNGGHEPGPLVMGSRIGIPAGVSMPAGLSPFGQMVWRALQQYGALVVDYVGGGWPMFTVDASGTTDAYVGPLYRYWDNNGAADYKLFEPHLRVMVQ